MNPGRAEKDMSGGVKGGRGVEELFNLVYFQAESRSLLTPLETINKLKQGLLN